MIGFKNCYVNLESNEEGNENMVFFSVTLSGNKSVDDRIKIATYDIDSVAVGADAENNVVVMHSLKN